VRPENVALGFRVKSGWAAAVLLSGSVRSPRLCDSFVIDLSDPRVPEIRQPYHAAMGKLETAPSKVNRRVRAVRSVTQRSITTLLAGYRRKGYAVRRAALVVGSQIDPVSIVNPHIRAHALEGQLFRWALEEALHAHRIRTEILIERNAYASARAQLKRSNHYLGEMIQKLGRSTKGPWRAEQNLAALAASLALRWRGRTGTSKRKKREPVDLK